MRKKILLIDSGVGGLSVLKKLNEYQTGTDYYYFGDNANAPYGNKSVRELQEITFRNIKNASVIGADAIVIACGTLSATLREFIAYESEVPVFSYFPPIERICMRGGNNLLLATNRTAEKYKDYFDNLSAVGLSSLAEDIEKNLFSLNRIKLEEHLRNVKTDYDNVILGCTHYNFLKTGIKNHFRTQNVFDGVEDTCNQVQKWLKSTENQHKLAENRVFFFNDARGLNKMFWNYVVNRGV